ncbi:MAG: putative sulfate/molybdate transporter, partial [Candidatus Zixiibacteriota bacterium]
MLSICASDISVPNIFKALNNYIFFTLKSEEHSITKDYHTPLAKDKRIKLNRNELAGAFGDLGTFIPFVTGVIVVSGINPVSILLAFGIFYIFSGLTFGVPMPVQPMKAIATLAITERVDPGIVVGAGLFIGAFFLFSAVTGFLDRVERITPKSVIRGIQLGLGLRMAMSAATYMLSNHPLGGFLSRIEIFHYLPLNWVIAIAGMIIILLLFRNKRVPAAFVVLLLGMGISILNGFPSSLLLEGINPNLPSISVPSFSNMIAGIALLAIPQIPLTIGTAVMATRSLFQI